MMQYSYRKIFYLALLFSVLPFGQSFAIDPFSPLPDQPPIPEYNPQTPEKIELGKQLYFDPRLSYSGKLTCNDCHNVMAGGDDNRAVSEGALDIKGKRNTPTIWNVAYQTAHYWDARAATLEQAVASHLVNRTVMGQPDEATLVARLRSIPGYFEKFSLVFAEQGGLSYRNITRAIASYLRTLVTANSPYDRYLKGDKTAMSERAKKGFQEYIDTGCAACHFWVNMAGPVPGLAFQQGEGFFELFPNNPGSKYDDKYRLTDDQGLIHITHNEKDRYLWRVPTLRNIALTMPYFHNGSVDTLDEAVRVMAKTQLEKDLSRDQVDNIVAFLKTLTGEFPEQTMPRLPGMP